MNDCTGPQDDLLNNLRRMTSWSQNDSSDHVPPCNLLAMFRTFHVVIPYSDLISHVMILAGKFAVYDEITSRKGHDVVSATLTVGRTIGGPREGRFQKGPSLNPLIALPGSFKSTIRGIRYCCVDL